MNQPHINVLLDRPRKIIFTTGAILESQRVLGEHPTMAFLNLQQATDPNTKEPVLVPMATRFPDPTRYLNLLLIMLRVEDKKLTMETLTGLIDKYWHGTHQELATLVLQAGAASGYLEIDQPETETGEDDNEGDRSEGNGRKGADDTHSPSTASTPGSTI